MAAPGTTSEKTIVKNIAILLLVALVAGLGAFFLGRLSNRTDPPRCPPEATTVPEAIATREPEPIVVPPDKPVDVTPPEPVKQPERAPDLNLVRQTMRPGKTYQTHLKGNLTTLGTDLAWGIESVVSIHYVFEGMVDREIVENDGEVIVELRHFRDVRSLKIDTDLQNLTLKLGEAKLPLLLGVGLVFPKAAFVVEQLDGLSAKPVLDVLRALGVDAARLTGVKSRVFKVFTQFDSLTGKSVKIVYWNKEERTGVIQIMPIQGSMTESERFLHSHSAVLSDVLIFPERNRKPGEPWKVRGDNFTNLIDPGLRAAVQGELTLSRRANRASRESGQDEVVLAVEDGRLLLVSSERHKGQLGWFEPRGEMFFSPEEQIVSRAELSGKGLLERVSRNHLLFKTEMKQSPEISVVYSCRMIDTPAPGKKQ
jgi:hypothetical protein